jgi:putative modified peptide
MTVTLPSTRLDFGYIEGNTMPFKLSEATVDTLLDKLSSDDDFRGLFQASPRRALASLGHDAAASAKENDVGAWTCMTTAPLASKQEIAASRQLLRNQLLTSAASQSPHYLQSSKT